MAGQTKKENDLWSWLFIFFMLWVFWPVGLFLLFSKLFGKDEKKQQTAPPLGASVREEKQAQPSRARKTVGKVTRSPVAKKSNAKVLKIAGIVVAVFGLLACYSPIDMMIWLGEIDSYYVQELLSALAVAVGGFAMLGAGTSMDKAMKRYTKYLSVMGDREAIAVEELARVLGYPKKRVEKDLQKMIDKGYFGGKAYLNMELGYLFRSSQADADFQKQRQAATARPPKEAEEGYSGILRNIRRANDRIADPVLSAKIDRLEDITAKIFQAVEADPRKRSRIDAFLNYYLPTTQKLLDSYAEFESAGVEGENLRQAKSRIEATMDSIVRGFEHQLDELYQSDAMDVDSDIRVMETMLNRDTATVERDFGLGGTAAQREEQEH